MADLVVSRNAQGQRILSYSYFNLTGVLTPEGELIRPRDAATRNLRVRARESDGSRVSRSAEWFHRIQNVAAVGGATAFTAPSIGRYSSAGLRSINGVRTAVGDRIELPPTVGRLFTPRVPGGIYRMVSLSPPTMRLAEPPIYSINADGIGGAVYYRQTPNVAGAIEGLASPAMTSTKVTQGAIQVLSPLRWIDRNMGTYADAQSLSNGQAVTIEINEVPNVVAVEWTIGAGRQAGDASSKYAFGNVAIFMGANQTSQRNFQYNTATLRKSNLQVYNGNTWANSATGSVTYYNVLGFETSVWGVRYSDQGNSRAILYDIRMICHSQPCQIRAINGEVPEVGSLVRISASAGFYPALPPGTYPVLQNDNLGPWRLGPLYQLIPANGAATEYALYVDSDPYNNATTETIVFGCGALYQLRVATVTAATQVVYWIQSGGSAPQEIGRSTNGAKNFSIDYMPSIAQFENAQQGVTQIWADVDGVDRPRRMDCQITFSNVGTVSPAAGATFAAGSTMTVNVVPDADRAFAAVVWFLLLADGNVALSGSFTGATRSVDVVLPSTPGNYTLSVRIQYGDTALPSERLLNPINLT